MIYVKGYGFLPFAKNMSDKNSQKLLDSARISKTDAVKAPTHKLIHW